MTKSPDRQQSATDSMSMLAIASKVEATFLPTSNPNQRFHRRWWTTLPAIPSTRDCAAYRRLWRQFADHTMNTFAVDDGIFAPRNRGFYVEGREDHLVPAFFENFALFPDFCWLECLLDRLGIHCEGDIKEARWSYSYEEVLPGERRPRIADVVIMWRDASEDGILVVEAKKPGCGRNGLNTKDDPAGGYYLNFQAMRSVTRRSQALLIDQCDLAHLPFDMRSASSVVTWQELVAIQISAVKALNVEDKVREIVLSRLDAHHYVLGVVRAQSPQINARADAQRYTELRGLIAPNSVKDWLIGSELFFAAHDANCIIELPYDWLAKELTILEYAVRREQSTAEREKPLWRI